MQQSFVNMVKIPVLFTLLLQLLQMLMTVFGQSPCPPTFTYFRHNVTHKVMGKIWIDYPPKDQIEYHLEVFIVTEARLPDMNYPGEVKLEKSPEDTIRDIQHNKPLVYLIHFPFEQPLPHIEIITLNKKRKCYGDKRILDPGPNLAYYGIIWLEHLLFFHNNTRKWFGGAIGKLWTEVGYEVGNKHRPPTDAPIFELISPTNSTTQAPTSTPSMHGRTTEDTIGCGRNANIVVPLIANGVMVSRGEWPWVVTLFVARKYFRYQCVGSLLTNRHVITAAHCVRLKDMDSNLPPSLLYASMGRNRLRKWREEGAVNVQVLNYTIHPDYAYNASADSDLAILFLWSSVEFSPTIKPICLWTGPTDLENVVRKTGYVVGWGRDESGRHSLAKLRMVNVPIVSQTECLWSDPQFITFTSNRTFCAGSQDGSGPCNGDSGSGLMLHDPTTDRYYIRGVASRSLVNHSTMACDLNYFVVFVDVAKYTGWIKEHISTD